MNERWWKMMLRGVFIPLYMCQNPSKSMPKNASKCPQKGPKVSPCRLNCLSCQRHSHGRDFASHGSDWLLFGVTAVTLQLSRLGLCLAAKTPNRASRSFRHSIRFSSHFLPLIFQLQKHVFHAILIHFSSILIHSSSTYKKHENILKHRQLSTWTAKMLQFNAWKQYVNLRHIKLPHTYPMLVLKNSITQNESRTSIPNHPFYPHIMYYSNRYAPKIQARTQLTPG